MDFIKLFILATILNSMKVVALKQKLGSVEKRPEKCQASPDFLYLECCIFPPFFARDVARMCGAIFAVTYIDLKNNVTGLRRQTQTGCQHWRCILQRYLIMGDNDFVDEAKYYGHLDNWVEYNPDFRNVMLNAKRHCKESFKFYMPLTACEFFQWNGCIRHFIKLDCPSIRDTKECLEQRRFYTTCRKYFYKK